MHKRLYTSLTAVTALVLSAVLMVPAFGAVKEQAVDTILLEPETLWEDEVPVDLSWKTQQDKGRWIDEMGIAGDSKSLILVINNLETEGGEEIPVQTRNGKKGQSSSRELALLLFQMCGRRLERGFCRQLLYFRRLRRGRGYLRRIPAGQCLWPGKRSGKPGFLPPVKPEGLLDHRSGG